jgi:hypothetical protein
MFMRRRRWLRAAVIGGGAFGAGKKFARRSAERARQGRPVRQHDDQQLQHDDQQLQHDDQQLRQHDDERNERLATDPEFTAAKAKRLSG